MGQIYKWKEGSRIKADPELAAQVLDKLASENRLNAESVVDVSKPKDAVLHDDFEWNDKKAALEYRKDQARYIMRSLVLIEETEPDSAPIRYCFQIEEKTSNYTPINVIMQNSDSVEALKRKALSELMAYSMKYDTIIKKCHAEPEILTIKVKLENTIAE